MTVVLWKYSLCLDCPFPLSCLLNTTHPSKPRLTQPLLEALTDSVLPAPLPELVESKNLYYSCSCHLELGQGLQHSSHSVNN